MIEGIDSFMKMGNQRTVIVSVFVSCSRGDWVSFVSRSKKLFLCVILIIGGKKLRVC